MKNSNKDRSLIKSTYCSEESKSISKTILVNDRITDNDMNICIYMYPLYTRDMSSTTSLLYKGKGKGESKGKGKG